MCEVFKSKVDTWLICLIFGLVLITTVPIIVFAFSWLALILTLILVVFIFIYVFGIEYIIDTEANVLKIKCGFNTIAKIPIRDISKIVPDSTSLSAPAASRDRMALYLKTQFSPVIISPKDKEGFVQRLVSLNPDIQAVLSQS